MEVLKIDFRASVFFRKFHDFDQIGRIWEFYGKLLILVHLLRKKSYFSEISRIFRRFELSKNFQFFVEILKNSEKISKFCRNWRKFEGFSKFRTFLNFLESFFFFEILNNCPNFNEVCRIFQLFLFLWQNFEILNNNRNFGQFSVTKITYFQKFLGFSGAFR